MIGDHEVIILIDLGATSNFISEEVAQQCSLTVTPTNGFGVAMGNGQVIAGQGKCTGVPLNIQGVDIAEDFYLFALGTTDIVLGYSWLATLGDTRVNWGRHTLKFKMDERWITLLGDPALLRQQISLNSLEKILKQGDTAYLLELSELFTEQKATEKESVAAGIQNVLQRHKQVFQLPKGLPPSRNREHTINLQSCTTPINSRPYRYSFTQKNEMEALIREMLPVEIIWPSISPFSSTVLLVKKKDGGWRFCMDYRALNKATIPDRYLIPVIEELLDELQSATVFSKLDLKYGYHHIRMRKEDVEKTAFRIHEGHYEFLVMSFGLTNALATFQSVMNDLF